MTDRHGDFIWYELISGDPAGAESFYSSLLGWDFGDAAPASNGYQVFTLDGAQIGGLLPLTKEMEGGGARSTWLGYIRVENITEAVESAQATGASLAMGPQEVSGAGTFALISDPQGAFVYLMEDHSGVASQSFSRFEPEDGTCAWNELASADPEGAGSFYSSQFGWVQDSEMEMGPLGTYTFYRTGGENSYMLGGMYRMVPEDPAPHWLYYFRVPDLDSAKAKILQMGGNLHVEPTEIPGGEFSMVGADPQGAFFGLVGPKGA